MMGRVLTCSLLAGCLVVLLLETPNAVREVRLGIAGPYGDVEAPVTESISHPTVAIPFQTVQAAEPATAERPRLQADSVETRGVLGVQGEEEDLPILASLPE